jgi:sulfur carrier protein
MNIRLNNNSLELKDSISILNLIKTQDISSKGIAVAINGFVVTKSEWQTTTIIENDSIIIIKATQGG